ncbi:MAG: serine/threonine protein phosphatase [Geobacter sp.]|nr:MAG: serine/threonine protein phosphatase [Geobacter sp.]
MTSRRFVIPDIHGCALTLRHLVEDVLQPGQADALYLLGDYIDRGPRSREVIELIRSWSQEGLAVHPLRGNHEEMLLDACRDRTSFRLWMLNGGYATLASYGVEDACELPLPHRAILSDLPLYMKLDDVVLVHAGLNFTLDDPFSDREAMLWVRSTKVDSIKLDGRKLVCGHTPTTRKAIEASMATDLITLDNGCVYAGAPGLGSLAALELNTLTLLFQENIDV